MTEQDVIYQKTGFLIAGTASGVGKTTVTLAIMAAARRRGLIVQPFKGGPDFLDTGHQTRIAGRTSRNLDTWMLSHETNCEIFRKASRGADVLIAEGMMGLFDGKDGTTETGSSAEIAKLLRLPVVLVLDAGKSARSIAAVVLGFEMFDPTLPLAGVILNRVASERHFKMLQSAIALRCQAPVLGWLPRDAAIAIPERHLGLQSVEEESTSTQNLNAQLESLSSLAERHLNLDHIFELRCGLNLDEQPQHIEPAALRVRIGIARDAAFTFYYEDNLELLCEQGAELVNFSPLHDSSLPEDLDALFLGGGYPEIYARQLSSNIPMLASVRKFAASNCPVYAECGGMMYLTRSLTDKEGTEHAMAGLLPFAVEMTSKLVRFGYVTVTFMQSCLLGPAGTSIRGHSFHYSRIVVPTDPDSVEALETSTRYSVHYSLSGEKEEEGFGRSGKNILASYVHLHFRSNPLVAAHLFEAASIKAQPSAGCS